VFRDLSETQCSGNPETKACCRGECFGISVSLTLHSNAETPTVDGRISADIIWQMGHIDRTLSLMACEKEHF